MKSNQLKIMKKLLFAFAVAMIIMGGCKNIKTKSELEEFQAKIAIEEQNIDVVYKWLQEVNKENFEQMLNELWAADAKQYFNSSSESVDLEAFVQMIDHLYQQYPIIKHEVHDMIAEDDKVIARFSAHVTHDVESFGVPATGRELEWSAIAIFQLSDGKIVTRWEVTDVLGMYEQLGMELQIKED